MTTRPFMLLAAMAAASIATIAHAADVAIKAPPPVVLAGYPVGSGLYGGIGVVGAVLNADINGAGNTNLFSAGAALDLTFGYQFVAGGNWYAMEGSVQYTNMGGSVICGATPTAACSVSSRWGLEQRALIGFPIQTVLSVLPNLGNFFPGLPALPGGVNAVNGTAHPYLFAGVREDDVSAAFGLERGHGWKVQPVVGIGLRQQWTQGLVVDTSAGCTFTDTGFSLGVASSVKFGRDCRAALRFLY